MATTGIDESQQTAAKTAGAAYLLSFAIVVSVNFGIHERLFVANATETVRNVLAHERLFRIGIAGDLIYCAAVVVLIVALYVILKPDSNTLAVLAALWRLLWVVMWMVMTLDLFEVLRIAHGASYSQAEQLQSLVRFTAGAPRFDGYYVALLFGGLASTLCGYLWFKSRYIPRWLSIYGTTTSAFCVFCTLALYIDPAFDRIVNLWLFDAPMGFFDIALSFWLLIKGLRGSPAEALEAA